MEPIFQLTGQVVHGQGNGHTVGMPTANLPCPEGAALPPFGVYASLVAVDGADFLGVTNVGLRPSVDDSLRPTVETWLPDYSGSLYGREITLRLYYFLRPTVKMASLEDVKAQVSKDALAARRLLAK